MISKEFIMEYELTTGVVPSRALEDDILIENYKKIELGDVDGYRVVLYTKWATANITGFTFITDKATGATVGHIEHKMPSLHNRLALSSIRKLPTATYHMDNVCQRLLDSGHTLESDTTNTENGAHQMLMRLAKHPNVKTHIEDGEGSIIPHNGDITSLENQKIYTTSKHDSDFLNNDKHKYILVFRK